MTFNFMKRNGFTLIELMLSIAAFGTVMLILSGMLGTLYSARIRIQSAAEVDQVGSLILSRVLLISKNAKSVNSPLAGANNSTLNLNVDDSSKNPTIVNLVNGEIQIQEGSASPVTFGASRLIASDLLFENLARPGTPAIIRVSFTLAYKNPTNRSEYAVTKLFFGTASLY